MFDFHEKRKIRRIVYSKISIFFVFMLTLLLSTSVYERYTVSRDMRAKLDEKYAELEELELRAEVIEAKVEYLKDERGIEEELRNRFDVAKEGEQVVILLNSEEKKEESTQEKPISEPKEETFVDKLLFWRE